MDIPASARLPEDAGCITGPGLGDREHTTSEQPRVGAGSGPRKSRTFGELLSKRFVFSLIILVNGTVLVWFGKLGGEQFVYLCGLVIMGHNAASVVAAMRNR